MSASKSSAEWWTPPLEVLTLSRVLTGCGKLVWSLHLWNCLCLNEVLWVCLWSYPENGKSMTTHTGNQVCLIFRHWRASGKWEAKAATRVSSVVCVSVDSGRLQGINFIVIMWMVHNPELIYFPPPPLVTQGSRQWDQKLSLFAPWQRCFRVDTSKVFCCKACHTACLQHVNYVVGFYTSYGVSHTLDMAMTYVTRCNKRMKVSKKHENRSYYLYKQMKGQTFYLV